MKRKDYTFEASDGKQIAMSKWAAGPLKPVKGIVQIIHGKAEHRKRYDHYASFLVDNGWTVVANDHRGHGETISSPEETGTFPDHEGWARVVQDLKEIKAEIHAEYPDQPLIILGHSMGSILARNVILEDPDNITGVILSGTTFSQGLLGMIGGIIAGGDAKRSPHTPSVKLENLAVGNFNKAFQPNRTEFDWLTRDAKIVDEYAADPLCGFPGTARFYVEFLKGIRVVCDQERINFLPKDLPIYVTSGDQDPAGGFTKQVIKTVNQYKKAGIKDLTLKFYPGGRHEILNEINKDEVYRDILVWMEAHL